MRIYIKSIFKFSLIWVFAVFASSAAAQQDSTANEVRKGPKVKGIVKDASTGEAIVGVNISVPGYSAAITDDEGRFTITVPDLSAVLALKGEGYQNKEYPVKKGEELEILLYEAGYSSFYNTVTLPSGTRSQYGVPYAVRSVDVERSQWESAGESAGSFMQGRVAGLNAVRRSGTPNSGVNLNIRGYNSLYASNQPLIVVDGMIYDDADYGLELIKNSITSPLTNIELRDIEDITVLKDGSSLYGTKGSNGVVMITTTRPKDFTTKIDAAVYGGFNQHPETMPVMNAGDYRTYLTQMMASRGISQDVLASQPYLNDDPQYLAYYRYHNDINWQKEVFQNSYNQNYYLKVTGGDNIARYGLSLGYLSNDGITQNTGLNKYSTRLNALLNLTPKLTAHANLSFIYNERETRDQGLYSKTSPIFLSLIKSPFLSINEVDDAGKVSPNLADVDEFDIGNPAALINKAIGANRNYRFFGNVNLGYEFNPSLRLASTLGLTYDKVRENFFIPNKGVANDTLSTDIALNRSGSEIQRLFSIYNDTYLNFNKRYSHRHSLNTSVGVRTQSNKTESDIGLGYNAATDDFVSVGAGTRALRQVGGLIGDWNWVNLYFSGDYGYLNRYFLSINMALDGSSRFGKNASDGISIGDNKFAFMPSAAAAWIISSEPFMSNSNAFDFMKLRASYGLSGNDDIGNYTARTYYVSQNLLGMQGLVRGNIGNPALQWETVRKANAGLDFAVLKERLRASVDVFANQTKNMIIYEPVNNASGFHYALSNSGGMKTRGFELGVNGRVLNHTVKLDLGLNLAKYKNEITELPMSEIITEFGGASFITKKGQAANLFYGLKAEGVFASEAEASASGLRKRMPNASLVPFTAGDMIFKDLNNDKIIDDADRMVIGNPNPDWLGTFTADISYKRFTLNTLFNFSLGNDIYNGMRARLESMSGYENQTKAVKNRWRAEGQQTAMPKAVWGDPMGNAAFSDRWIEDGSYLRLRTLALTYNLPITPKQIKYARIYATANNLFTVTNYLGYDPEFSASPSIFGSGVDMGLEPQFTSFQLGFRLGL